MRPNVFHCAKSDYEKEQNAHFFTLGKTLGPSFNFPGQPAKFCATHQEPGMEDVRSQKCSFCAIQRLYAGSAYGQFSLPLSRSRITTTPKISTAGRNFGRSSRKTYTRPFSSSKSLDFGLSAAETLRKNTIDGQLDDVFHLVS